MFSGLVSDHSQDRSGPHRDEALQGPRVDNREVVREDPQTETPLLLLLQGEVVQAEAAIYT